MATVPEHTTTGGPPLTYGGIAVSPVPGHEGTFATQAALAAVEEVGGFQKLAVRLFLAWAALRPTSRTTHRSHDGLRQRVLAYGHGLNDGSPGLVVSLAVEARAGIEPCRPKLPTLVLPAITWSQAAAADILIDVGPLSRRLGFFGHDMAVHAGAWRSVVVQHDNACAPTTPEERQCLVLLLNAVPRSNYPAPFTVAASNGAPVLLVAALDQWDDLVVRVAGRWIHTWKPAWFCGL